MWIPSQHDKIYWGLSGFSMSFFVIVGVNQLYLPAVKTSTQSSADKN